MAQVTIWALLCFTGLPIKHSSLRNVGVQTLFATRYYHPRHHAQALLGRGRRSGGAQTRQSQAEQLHRLLTARVFA